MKLVTYLNDSRDQLAILVDGKLYPTDSLHPDLPISMAMLLNYWEDIMPMARAIEHRIKEGSAKNALSIPLADAELLAPWVAPHFSVSASC